MSTGAGAFRLMTLTEPLDDCFNGSLSVSSRLMSLTDASGCSNLTAGSSAGRISITGIGKSTKSMDFLLSGVGERVLRMDEGFDAGVSDRDFGEVGV